jgi:DNA-directed RNA polymerase specialized sigma24 family protein
MGFDRRLPGDLGNLDDEELIAYAVAAREAGDPEAMREGLAVIAQRRLGDMIRRAKIKVPEPDAEDVAMLALGEAVLARFEGSSVGEFVNLQRTILARRIADYHQKAERSPDMVELPEEHRDEADEGRHRRDAAVSDPEVGAVDAQDVIDQVLGGLSAEHRRTAELYVFKGFSGEETANQVNQEFPDSNPKMSVDNVQQIASRFRKNLRGLLDDD